MKEQLKLKGKTIILTRAQNQQNQSRRIFESSGARILDLPALIIGPPDEWDPLDDALKELESFHWIIFSSSNGIESVQARLQRNNLSLSNLPQTLKIAVVGRKTANALYQLGVEADFVPPEFVADSLIENFPVSAAGLRMLIPRVQSGGRTVLVEAFEDAGAEVVEVSAYESTCPQTIPTDTLDALEKKEVDAITFTSGKTVLHVYQLVKSHFGNKWIDKLHGVKLISIGPQTTLSCQKYFNRVNNEALEHSVEGLLQACIYSLNKNMSFDS